ncbi:MAG: SagB/ThcOx family dehydrogenase [Bacteroidales bacterium]|nr:SagB/ThcOx family dehydrogenase [Bacteroidales bacterium]
MKLRSLILGILLTSFAGVSAQTVSLPAPQVENGPAVLGIMAQRQSTTAFDSRALADQDLANLLWGALGQNRENGKLTAPSARNMQEVRLFVFTENGVSEYLPHGHELKKVAEGDHRDLVAAHQDFVKSAPVSIVIVMDMDKFGGTQPRQISMATIDAGIVCQNINVTAAGLGLASRPRGSMNSDAIKELLDLNENKIPIMNNVIGYPAAN